MKALVMTKRQSKTTKRVLHHSKNALKIHARHCYDPERCTYGKEFGADARRLNDDGVLKYHMENCAPKVPGSWPKGPGCNCWKRLENYSCQAAVDAENAAAEIERHLAAIRKIKRRGKPLKGRESYGVYPE